MNIRAHWFAAYTTAMIGMLAKLSITDRVLPVFKNQWYELLEGYEILGWDACETHIFRYNLFTYTDLITNSLPSYSDCAWDYNNPTSYFPDSPKTIFNSFICSADPVGNCPTHYENQSIPVMALDNLSSTGACAIFNTSNMSKKNETKAVGMFQSLRLAFYDKSSQRLYLSSLVMKYQQSMDINRKILFARCLCFELGKLLPEKINDNVRELLVSYLLAYRDFIHDNFALSTFENKLNFYVTNPICHWLSAFLTAKTGSLHEKHMNIVDYIDNENDVIKKADLVSSVGSEIRKIVPINKQCEYGRFFQHAYTHNKNASIRDKRVLWSALALLKTHSIREEVKPSSACRNASRF